MPALSRISLSGGISSSEAIASAFSNGNPISSRQSRYGFSLIRATASPPKVRKTFRLPSGEMRKLPLNAKATIGTVGNSDHENVRLGKAGRVRHMGIRPTVRGVVMNPCDHPHGGGEGKSPVGMPAPVTPWGKPALGYKTRKHKKYSNKMIVKRANDK